MTLTQCFLKIHYTSQSYPHTMVVNVGELAGSPVPSPDGAPWTFAAPGSGAASVDALVSALCTVMLPIIGVGDGFTDYQLWYNNLVTNEPQFIQQLGLTALTGTAAVAIDPAFYSCFTWKTGRPRHTIRLEFIGQQAVPPEKRRGRISLTVLPNHAAIADFVQAQPNMLSRDGGKAITFLSLNREYSKHWLRKTVRE